MHAPVDQLEIKQVVAQVCAVARFLPLPLLCLLPDELNRAEEDTSAWPSDMEKAEAHIGAGTKEAFAIDGGTGHLTPKT